MDRIVSVAIYPSAINQEFGLNTGLYTPRIDCGESWHAKSSIAEQQIFRFGNILENFLNGLFFVVGATKTSAIVLLKVHHYIQLGMHQLLHYLILKFACVTPGKSNIDTAGYSVN